MANLDSIFAPNFNMNQPGADRGFKKEEFAPNAKSGKNGEYKAVVRFIPWYQDPENPIFSKVQGWIVDPTTNRGRTIDSPKSINQQCPIVDLFWQLMNSGREEFKQLAKKCLSTSTTYTALVQVMVDEQHPENVGKILPWRFKKTIWDKIYNEMHPQMGKGHNPFDIINGRYFSIKVTLKSNYNNYDNCLFFDYAGDNGETSGMWIKNAYNQWEIVTANSDRQAVYDYLVANTPDMSKYTYNEWTEEDSKFVTGVLNTISDYANMGTVGQNLGAINGSPIMSPSAVPAPPTMGGFVHSTPSAVPTPPMMEAMMMPTPAAPAVSVPTMDTISAVPSMPSMPNITGVDVPNTVTTPKVNPATQKFNLGNLPIDEM